MKKTTKPVAKEFAEFEKYTKGIGSKILYKMGYRPGQGLGKGGRGLAEPIQVKLRPAGVGIGHGAQDEPKDDISIPKVVKEKKSQRKELVTTSVQIIQEIDEQPTKSESIEIIDMTGPQTRVISDMSLLPKVNEGPLVELRYNIDALCNLAKRKLEVIARQRKSLAGLIQSRNAEILEAKALIEKNTTLKENGILVVNVLLKCNSIDNSKNPLKIYHELKPELDRLDTLYEDEDYKLEAFFCSLLTKSFKDMYQEWNPLTEPLKGYDAVMAWAGALRYRPNRNSAKMSPFEHLLYQNWLPNIRQSINNEWSPLEPESILSLIQSYKPILPEWLLYNILQQLVVPKLKNTLESWPIKQWKFHTITFPWLLLDIDLEEECLAKITEFYRKWSPEDAAGLELYQTWVKVLPDIKVEKMITAGVLPRLVKYLRINFKIDPLNQDIIPLQHIFSWHPFIPPNLFSELFGTEFFNRWLDTLWNWLSAPSVVHSEVVQWYEAWKQLFQPLDIKSAKDSFKVGLDMMNQGTSANRPKEFITSAPAKHPELVTQELKFKDYVQQLCEESNVEFVPLYRQTKDGNDMYRIGKLVVYLEDGVVWGRVDGKWNFMSVEDAIAKSFE